ncbi:MOSC domain-containing protein [Virgibacillus sediminis]|uniref:MOSC domain-containing protein n=1 Tax=Virgibacillus sediminis TaxID=202260 RepID=A0ABV7A9H9_9BACI
MEAWVEGLLIGRVKKVDDPEAEKPGNRSWKSGMFKEESNHRILLEKAGLQGDEVADKKNHGGPEKAVFAYPCDHYGYWESELDLYYGMKPGAMGENLAVKGLDETSVCIGDIFELGEADVQVSQPRKPCWKPGRRFGRKDFAWRIQETGRTGWYFRVLQEGRVGSGDSLALRERPHPKWSIAVCNELMYAKEPDRGLLEELASCPLLADMWKLPLVKKLKKRQQSEVLQVGVPLNFNIH